MTEKIDLVLEAVHFQSSDRLEYVRLYERRDSSYSDRILYSRDQLLSALLKKKKVAIGQRQKGLASTFSVTARVVLTGTIDQPIITVEEHETLVDLLPGLPFI